MLAKSPKKGGHDKPRNFNWKLIIGKGHLKRDLHQRDGVVTNEE
jgi:hypothetical protein